MIVVSCSTSVRNALSSGFDGGGGLGGSDDFVGVDGVDGMRSVTPATLTHREHIADAQPRALAMSRHDLEPPPRRPSSRGGRLQRSLPARAAPVATLTVASFAPRNSCRPRGGR